MPCLDGRQIGTEIEKVVLDATENGIERIALRVKTDHADARIGFVHRAIGLDAKVVFRAASTGRQRGRAGIARAGIDPVQNDHVGLQRRITMSSHRFGANLGYVIDSNRLEHNVSRKPRYIFRNHAWRSEGIADPRAHIGQAAIVGTGPGIRQVLDGGHHAPIRRKAHADRTGFAKQRRAAERLVVLREE